MGAEESYILYSNTTGRQRAKGQGGMYMSGSLVSSACCQQPGCWALGPPGAEGLGLRAALTLWEAGVGAEKRHGPQSTAEVGEQGAGGSREKGSVNCLRILSWGPGLLTSWVCLKVGRLSWSGTWALLLR